VSGPGLPGRWWHGGAPGLRAGDMIVPGHERRAVEGCPWCEARARGDHRLGDGPVGRPDQVYVTGVREYARYYASLWGRGDLYRVEPEGDLEVSHEDTVPTWTAPAARVVAVVERAVLLTMGQRRRLYRIWTAADAVALERSRS